jgi:hypothetical protein
MVPWCALACCCSSAVCLILPPNLTLPQAQFVKFKEGAGVWCSSIKVDGLLNGTLANLASVLVPLVLTNTDASAGNTPTALFVVLAKGLVTLGSA